MEIIRRERDLYEIKQNKELYGKEFVSAIMKLLDKFWWCCDCYQTDCVAEDDDDVCCECAYDNGRNFSYEDCCWRCKLRIDKRGDKKDV